MSEGECRLRTVASRPGHTPAGSFGAWATAGGVSSCRAGLSAKWPRGLQPKPHHLRPLACRGQAQGSRQLGPGPSGVEGGSGATGSLGPAVRELRLLGTVGHSGLNEVLL